MQTDFDALFQQAGQRFNVDPDLLRAVSGAESGGNFDTADSSAGAMGGMQIMPDTYAAVAKQYGLSGDPRSPANQIMAGAAVLSQNLDRYGDVPDALRAYNGGTDPSRWNNPETSAYPGRVASFYQPGATAASSSSSPDTSSSTPAPYQVAANDTGTRSDVMPSPFAPPSSAPTGSAPPPPAALSDDDLHSMLTSGASAWAGSAPPTSSGAPAAASPANVSDDDLHAMLTAGSSSTGQPAVATPAPGSASSTAPANGGGFLGGLKTVGEGIANAANRLGAYVDQNVPALGAVDQATLPTLGMDQPAQVTARLTPDIAARDQAGAGSMGYAAGKIAGDVGATIPAAMIGAPLLGGIARVVPMVGDAGSAIASGVRALPGGSSALTIAQNALTGAGAGAAGAAITSGQSDQPFADQVEQGAKTGAVLGVAAPLFTRAASSIADAVRGGTISTSTAQLADLARNTYNIPLSAGQIAESPTVRFAASTANRVPFSGAGAEDTTTQVAFNRAVAKTFGEDAPALTPDVMQAARTRLGNTFDSLAQNSFQADHQLVSDLADVETNAQQVLPASEWKPISTQLDNVLGSVDSQGNISGDAYQVLTRKGAPLDRAQSSSDPNVSFYAGQVRDALDDALARGLPQDQQDLLQQARSQWKALKTVEPLVGKSTLGNISPPSLMTPVQSSYGNIAYTGGGPLGDLARIGQLMKAPPDSGTASRLTAWEMMKGTGAAAGATIAGLTHPMDAAYATGGTLASLIGGAGAARAVRSYLGSPLITNSLISRGLAGNEPSQVGAALIGGALPAGVAVGNDWQRQQVSPAALTGGR